MKWREGGEESHHHSANQEAIKNLMLENLPEISFMVESWKEAQYKIWWKVKRLI